MKKAMSQDTLIIVLVMIVVAASLGYIGVHITEFILEKGDTESCRISVLASDQSPAEIQLQCPRKQVVLYPDYYTIDNRKEKYSSQDYATNVKRVIADQMKECWYKMGEGNVDPFTAAWVGTTNVCLMCSHIRFENSPAPDVGNMYEYIQNTKITPSALSLEDATYYDYIYRPLKINVYQGNAPWVIQALGLPSESKITSNIWIFTPDNLFNKGTISTDKEYDLFYYGYVPEKKIDLTTAREDEDYALALYYTNEDILSTTCEYTYS